MFNKFKRWLEGVFICQKCGGEMLLFTFGYGECICVNCYDGEKQFIFFDTRSYWLNVIQAFFQTRIRKKLGSKQGYIICSTTSSAIKKQQNLSAILI